MAQLDERNLAIFQYTCAIIIGCCYLILVVMLLIFNDGPLVTFQGTDYN